MTGHSIQIELKHLASITSGGGDCLVTNYFLLYYLISREDILSFVSRSGGKTREPDRAGSYWKGFVFSLSHILHCKMCNGDSQCLNFHRATLGLLRENPDDKMSLHHFTETKIKRFTLTSSATLTGYSHDLS